ncbi:MAG: ferrous iron transporter B [Thermoanaerobaculia bacterium]
MIDRVSAAPPRPATTRARRVALVGNPNTGKTTLFNRLCGLRAKTANFPGTTTDLRVGRLAAGNGGIEIVDLPGLYSLTLDQPEASVARRVLAGEGDAAPDAAVVVADATNLMRNLLLVDELRRTGVSVVVALNMIDLARRRGLSFDPARLARRLEVPVVAVSARRGEGIDRLIMAVGRVLAERAPGTRTAARPPATADEAEAREAWAESVVLECLGGEGAVGAAGDSLADRLDATFTHPILGLACFFGVMAALFWTLFALAKVPMDLIEATFSHLGGLLTAVLPAGAIRDLLVGGLIGGVSGTIVFLPQICLLFFLITLLEDTGYLARAAFVMDRLLCRFGLPGYAFVPLLSSHACAIPGILSTKLIPDRHDRLATILVAPFMSCSARLPVYVLLTGFLFRDHPLYAGMAFAGCYLLGSIAALGSALLARRTILPGRSRPMILELPSYKMPSLRVALAAAIEQGWAFLKTAGTVILAICFVMWWLSAYPKSAPPAEARELARESASLAASEPERAAELATRADAVAARAQQMTSFAGRLGRFVQPVFAPLGYDWQLTMGVLTSFAAREVFVSTLAVLVEAPPDDPGAGVLAKIQQARRDDGSPLLTAASGVSLLVFFVLAMQCLSTLATVKRETRQWRWPILQFAWMTGLAYLGAWIAFHGLRAAGIA